MDRAAIVVYLAALVSSVGVGWLFLGDGQEQPTPLGWIPAVSLAALVAMARDLGNVREVSGALMVLAGGAIGALGWAGFALAVGPPLTGFALLATLAGEAAALTAVYLVLADDRVIDYFLEMAR